MRRLFASSMLLALTLAMIIGSAYAWSTSGQSVGTVRVGKQSVDVVYTPGCNDPPPAVGGGVVGFGSQTSQSSQTSQTNQPLCLDPASIDANDGFMRVVGRGSFRNTGDFDLVVTGGTILVSGLAPVAGPSPGPTGSGVTPVVHCQPSDFLSKVTVTQRILPAGQDGGEFFVWMGARVGAPLSCSGRQVLFELAFDAETAPQPR